MSIGCAVGPECGSHLCAHPQVIEPRPRWNSAPAPKPSSGGSPPPSRRPTGGAPSGVDRSLRIGIYPGNMWVEIVLEMNLPSSLYVCILQLSPLLQPLPSPQQVPPRGRRPLLPTRRWRRVSPPTPGLLGPWPKSKTSRCGRVGKCGTVVVQGGPSSMPH